MARFNTTLVRGPKEVNLAGGVAYSQTPKLEIASILLTSFAQDQFYRSADETFAKLRALIAQEPGFALSAAVYARDKFGLRSISHVAAVEVAHILKGAQVRKMFKHLVVRPDDAIEMLAYQMATYGKPIPNAMKKGIGDALSEFSAYSLAKYAAKGKSFSLVDVVNLCHPKHSEALTQLVKGTLPIPETWETKLSASGGDEEKKAEAWRELLSEKKLGYFALIRNLRNIYTQAPGMVDEACKQLVNPEAIHKSRVLPMRYLTALSVFDATAPRQLMAAIEDALDICVDNVPELPGRTLIALDESGSMASPMRTNGRPNGPRSAVSIMLQASLFAAALFERNDAHIISFSDSARYRTLNPRDTTASIIGQLMRDLVARGTNLSVVFETATQPYDRIIILSDMQTWVESLWRRSESVMAVFNRYRARTGCDPHVYSFDLAGYGTMQFPQEKVYALAGMSEKVFDIMEMLEADRNALVNDIEAFVV